MPNNSVNKVIYNNNTLIDLTGDTAIASDVASGKTFHLASGEQAVGTGGGSPSNPYIEYTYDNYGYVKTATMNGNWTLIPTQMFDSFEITSFSIPSTITKICRRAFASSYLQSITIPSNVKIIDEEAFAGCSALQNVTIQNGVEEIGIRAFHTSGVSSITFPSSLKTLRANLFYGSYSITTIRFLGTPTSIDSDAFSGSSTLTDIYVPWAQGAVANAPWGATNATIHYNSTV